jgi:hypothetical protein
MRRISMPLKRIVGVSLLIVFVVDMRGIAAQQPDLDRQIEDAQRLYREANFTEAVVKLQGTIDRLRLLSDLQARKAQLVDAHLLLALSYFALDERGSAKEHLKQVARLDAAHRLDPQVYAPPVIQLMQEARAEIALEGPAVRSPDPSGTRPAATKKGRRKGLLIGLGIAGVGAAGTAVAAAGGTADSGSRTESGAISVSPLGIALAAVTELTFNSTGFSTAPTWTFGDGGRATGMTVTHTYSTEGTFEVTAQTSAAAAALRVTVRSLTGTWIYDSGDNLNTMVITQTGASVSGTLTTMPVSARARENSPSSTVSPVEGSLSPPRNAMVREVSSCMRTHSLVLGADLTSMSGPTQHGHPLCPSEVYISTYLRQ